MIALRTQDQNQFVSHHYCTGVLVSHLLGIFTWKLDNMWQHFLYKRQLSWTVFGFISSYDFFFKLLWLLHCKEVSLVESALSKHDDNTEEDGEEYGEDDHTDHQEGGVGLDDASESFLIHNLLHISELLCPSIVYALIGNINMNVSIHCPWLYSVKRRGFPSHKHNCTRIDHI